MRISIIDLQCEDIMWFGVDKNNYIFECTSAGCGNVPEFVCCSKENTNKLHAVAKALIEQEKLDAQEFENIFVNN